MKRLEKQISFLLVLALCAGICLLFCTRKKGLFIDEVYSYGLANSYYAPFLSDLKGGDLTGKIFTAGEVDSYLSVGEEDAFSFGSVYHNQTKDVHPPLYYWVFHLVSSVFRGSTSKWIGLGINLFFFFLTLFALWRLSLSLFRTPAAASVAVLLYGVSLAGISTVMIIRMYMMMTFFSVALALAVLPVLRKGAALPCLVPVAFVIFLGAMTQYYFVFYACFLCVAVLVTLLRRRQFPSAVRFSLAALGGVGAMVAVFPACLKHMFVGNGQVVGGSSIADALTDFSSYLTKLRAFSDLRYMMKPVCIVFSVSFAAVIVLLLLRALLHRPLRGMCGGAGAGVVLLPAFAAFPVIAVISPVQELRYVYNLVPFFCLAAAFALDCVFSLAGGLFRGNAAGDVSCSAQAAGVSPVASAVASSASSPVASAAASAVRPGVRCPALSAGLRLAVLAAVAVLCVLCAKVWPPADLFPTAEDYDALVQAHCAAPCVYVSDNYFAPLTQDLLQLRHFPDFLVVNDAGSAAVTQYVGNADEAVLYIDINGFWSSGYDPDAVCSRFRDATGLTETELLYEYDYEYKGGLSQTYLMRRP